MRSHQNLLKNRSYQVNQELISYGTYETYTFTKTINTVMKLNNRTTAVEREHLKRNLYYDMGQVMNY